MYSKNTIIFEICILTVKTPRYAIIPDEMTISPTILTRSLSAFLIDSSQRPCSSLRPPISYENGILHTNFLIHPHQIKNEKDEFQIRMGVSNWNRDNTGQFGNKKFPKLTLNSSLRYVFTKILTGYYGYYFIAMKKCKIRNFL